MKNNTSIVEHIRSVHFTLIALCIGLFLTLQLDKSATAEKAQEELDKILHASGNWTPDWIEKDAEKAYKEYLKKSQYTGRSKKISFTYPNGDNRLPSYFIVPNLLWTLWTSELYAVENVTDYIRPLSGRMYIPPPETVDQFRKQWDFLSRIKKLNLLADLPDNSNAIYLSWEDSSDIQVRMIETKSEDVNDILKYDDNMYGIFLDVLPDIYKNNIQSITEYRKSYLLPEFVLRIGTKGSVSSIGMKNFTDQRLESGMQRAVFIPVGSTLNIPFNPQDAFMKRHGLNQRFGKFADTFPHLNEITKDLKDISFKNLDTIVAGEVKRGGGERFEFFGTKIPTSALTKWGLVILLGVQFYFYMHLNTLVERIKRRDSSLDIAWIGLYKNVFAKISVIVSGALFPLFTAYYVCLKATDYKLEIHFNWLSVGLITGMLMSFILSISIAKKFIALWTKI